MFPVLSVALTVTDIDDFRKCATLRTIVIKCYRSIDILTYIKYITNEVTSRGVLQVEATYSCICKHSTYGGGKTRSEPW
jgi:hypothetical protein